MSRLRIHWKYTKTHWDTWITPFHSYHQTWTRNLSRRCRHTDNMTLVLHTCSMQSVCKLYSGTRLRLCACGWIPALLQGQPLLHEHSLSHCQTIQQSCFHSALSVVIKCRCLLHIWPRLFFMWEQREAKGRGTESGPDVSLLNCGSRSLRSLPPWLPWHPRQRGDKSGTASPAYTASGESLRSYLLYHLHCRTAVDCCLTSTL